jgi:hypothetical protein
VAEEQAKEYYKYENKNVKLDFGGSYNNWADDEFIESALELFENETKWTEAINTGEKILLERMNK